jgi:hypothetical protein
MTSRKNGDPPAPDRPPDRSKPRSGAPVEARRGPAGGAPAQDEGGQSALRAFAEEGAGIAAKE